MDNGEVMLLGSIFVTGAAVLWSFYLLWQAIVDYRVLLRSKKNGALKALSLTAIVAETIRSLKLVLLQTLFIISLLYEPDELLVVRRAVILAVILLIATGSIYGGIARRALIRLVDEELSRSKETTYTLATELLPDEDGGTFDGEGTIYRVEQVEKPTTADLPLRPAPEAD